MKKLKLLFPLLGTSALVVTPALAAQTNQSVKSKLNASIRSFPLTYQKDGYSENPTYTRNSYDNNKTLFVNGYSMGYYYDHPFATGYSEANLTFTFTSVGATALALNKMYSSASTSDVIMAFLDKNLKHFDNGYKNSYLNEIEDVSTDHLMHKFSDGYAYADFKSHLGQPVSQVNQLVTLLKEGRALPEVSVKFHYNYHRIAHDDFDVSFTFGKYPPSTFVKITPSKFIGHFPGMGPYGKVGDQDHAKLISSESTSESLKLDLSTKSINYINSHFLNKPVPSSKIALAVMDYLWKAYPSSDWKATLAGILRAGGVPAVNYAFGKLIDFIGTYQKDGKTLLKNTPAYYYIKDGDSFTAAKNQPFS